MRAHGQYGIRVTDPRAFLETLISNMGSFSTEQIDQFYRERIISALNALLAQQIVNNRVSIATGIIKLTIPLFDGIIVTSP